MTEILTENLWYLANHIKSVSKASFSEVSLVESGLSWLLTSLQ